MKVGAQSLLAQAARLHMPIIALFAFSVLAVYAPGGGVGFVAGLAFALALTLHALVFGATASRAAFPPLAWRALLGLGVLAAIAGASASRWAYAPLLAEGALFAVTAAASALIVQVLFGRASAMRDAELR